MNIVSLALQRPVQVVVVTLALLLLGLSAAVKLPRDVLPSLGVPTLYVAQPYGGMSPEQMEGFLTYYYEYHFLYISGIEHVESKSIQGTSLIKLQFHPGTDMNQAMAETVGYVNRARAFMPPGTVPPFLMRFDAGSVPVGNLVFASDTLSVGAIQDAALNRVRPLFATLPGVSAPPPFGGSARSIVIQVDPQRLRANDLSPEDVVRAVSQGNSLSPAGLATFGDQDRIVPSNALIRDLKDFLRIPLRVDGSGSRVYLNDVATIQDATDIPTSYALINGKRTVYIPVTKRSNASTLSVVQLVKDNLSRFQAALPDGVQVSYQFDQSGYVTRAIDSLVQEGLLGAILSGLMVLLFLRDLRSALIVVINIPLALAMATFALALAGQTVNLMTLGGLALAVGILVDESTVTVENVHTHLAAGKSLPRAVSDAGREVAGPLLISMLCILAVFVPSFFMTGAPRALFAPLALAVGLAMLASYLLSRTLVSVLCCWLLRPHAVALRPLGSPRPGFRCVLVYLVVVLLLLVLLVPALGQDIFPQVDQGQFQLRFKAPAGTRLEHTEQLVRRVNSVVASAVGEQNVQVSLAFLGTQPANFPINTIYLWTSGPEEAVVQYQLKPGVVALPALQESLRQEFARSFPEVSFSFEPSDVISRALSFGSMNPIEVAVSGPDLAASRQFAGQVMEALTRLPELRDLHYGQTLDFPALAVNVDRTRAAEQGATTEGVARSVVEATWSSRFTTPNYWADPKSGIAYQVQVQLPRTSPQSAAELLNLPVNARGGTTLLRNLASVEPTTVVGEYDRYNMQRTVSVNANYAGTDLGRVSRAVRGAVAALGPAPARVNVAYRGLLPALNELRSSLSGGLSIALVAIVLLLCAHFQSWRSALAVLTVAPAALAGATLMLFVTRTTLNLESYMGMIMAVGVGTANAILLVARARAAQAEGHREPGMEAAESRLRPILMTTLAMGAGMLPMALGWGEGAEQTAPLARAVVGGLAGSTLTAIWVLPVVYQWLHRLPLRSVSLDPDDPSSPVFERPA